MYTKKSFSKAVSIVCKEVRIERRIRQEEMAEVLGISRKTLVQTEKGRRILSWTEAVCLATLFKDSPTLKDQLKDDPIKVISEIDYLPKNKERIVSKENYFWDDVIVKDSLALQQNIISKEYRIADKDSVQLYTSFDYDEILDVFRCEEKKISQTEREKELKNQ